MESFLGVFGGKGASYVYTSSRRISLLLTLVLGFASDSCNNKDILYSYCDIIINRYITKTELDTEIEGSSFGIVYRIYRK